MRTRALRRRYGRSRSRSGKMLNVVHRDGRWLITGMKGKPLELFLHIPYPESEWPEVTSQIAGSKQMHRALYDLWQTSDELEAEAKRSGGLKFHTPFGDFETVGVDVVRAEDAVAARAAYTAAQARSNEIARIEEEVMARSGFGREQLKGITDRYGHRFAEWPKDVADAYWKAYHAASAASVPARARR